MADISRFLFMHHLRANPTAHVRHLRNGEVAHEGAGQQCYADALPDHTIFSVWVD